MPLYRKLHVKSVDSQDINDMPDDFTRLLWVMLPLGLDSEGRGIYNAGWVKAKIFPMRDDVTAERVAAALDWFRKRINEDTKLGMIVKYDVSGRSYFYVPTWHTYQGNTEKEAKSVIPAPVSTHEKRKRGSRVCQEPVQTNSASDADADADAQVDADAVDTSASHSVQPPPQKPEGKSERAGRPRDLLFDAICAICVIDPSVKGNGASVGRVRAELIAAQPPYTPDEIRAFGQWWNSDDFRRKRGPPTLWKLREQIGIVRNGNGSKPATPMTPDEQQAEYERLNPGRKSKAGQHAVPA